jgi:DNA-directed RNA polymerase beta' subunit
MSSKRLLTEYEIDNILSFIKPNKAIPQDAAMAVVKNNKNKLRKQLLGKFVYPEIIPDIKKKLEHQYYSSQIQPGECVGVGMAQSLGEKQTQLVLNSIDWFDIVLYVNDGKIIIEPIGAMIDSLLEHNCNDIKFYQKNNTEYLELSNGYFVPSGDENGINKWRKIEAVTRHLPNGKLVKVTTKSGRVVSASQCKSFLVWNGKKFINTLGSEVKIGDILPTTKNMPRFGNSEEYFNISNIYQENQKFDNWFYKHNGLVTQESDIFTSNFTKKIPLNKEFGFIVGLFLSDGWISRSCVHFSNKNPIIRQRVLDWCKHYSIVCDSTNTSKYLTLRSVVLTQLFKSLCYSNSNKKIVPLLAYTSSKKFIKGLIDAYISVGGIINKDYSICVSSVYEELILGISFLLSYLGIFGILSTSDNNIYNLTIQDNFIQIFRKNITLVDKQKQDLLDSIRKINTVSQNIYPNDRHVYFDPIVNIEYVTAHNGVVYDFTVVETRNFNLYNGLVIRDTFHTAGSGCKGVTQGVPRFAELLNATKSPKGMCCYIYFKNGNDSISSLRKMIGSSIVEITFKKIILDYSIVINKEPEKWYESFKIMYNDKFTNYKSCLSLKINMNIMYEYKITLEDVAIILSQEYSDMACVWSPENIGQLDIFIDTADINLPEDRLLFIDCENSTEIYIEEVVYPILNDIIISGIQGINDIFFSKDADLPGTWMVESNGSNLSDLLAHPDIDMTKTFSNNMWDIYNTLGVEATRQFLIEEFCQLMSGINECHVKILVDRMTFDGGIASISRYTMRSEQNGPLGRASFEETMDNFIKAGIFGQEEPTTGVSASIICGKRANIGTGLCELKMDIGKLPEEFTTDDEDLITL